MAVESWPCRDSGGTTGRNTVDRTCVLRGGTVRIRLRIRDCEYTATDHRVAHPGSHSIYSRRPVRFNGCPVGNSILHLRRQCNQW